MPKDWNRMSLPERAEDILRNIDGLTADDKQVIYAEWAKYTYTDNGIGQIQAEADLQEMAREHLLRKMGRWEQEEQRRNDNLMQKVNK
jgi:hypothetical protein